jgi:hypothetical protein
MRPTLTGEPASIFQTRSSVTGVSPGQTGVSGLMGALMSKSVCGMVLSVCIHANLTRKPLVIVSKAQVDMHVQSNKTRLNPNKLTN